MNNYQNLINWLKGDKDAVNPFHIEPIDKDGRQVPVTAKVQVPDQFAQEYRNDKIMAEKSDFVDEVPEPLRSEY